MDAERVRRAKRVPSLRAGAAPQTPGRTSRVRRTRFIFCFLRVSERGLPHRFYDSNHRNCLRMKLAIPLETVDVCAYYYSSEPRAPTQISGVVYTGPMT